MGTYRYPYGSIWISHSSISDFEKCPRGYYLKNVYKDPKIGKKIQVVKPQLSLGIAVHDTLEQIRYLPRASRFEKPLTQIFEEIWINFEGEMGGFKDADQEKDYKYRGFEMVRRVQDHPGPLKNLSISIKERGSVVSSMLLSDNLVLCGNVDWVEVLDDGSLHIIDFKTGKSEEKAESLQLPIYLLLAAAFNKFRPVTKISYWYLDRDDLCTEIALPVMEGVWEKLKEIGQKIYESRKLGKEIKCIKGGCGYCEEYERVLKGEGKRIGLDPVRDKILYYIS